MKVQPRLVPLAEEGPYMPPESVPMRKDLVSQLGFRPDQSIDAASAGVGMMPVFQPVVSLPDERVVGLRRWRAGRCSST